MTTYVLAGGCFWCFDAVFRELRGVSEVVVGYAGGTKADASYDRVLSGRTGHAEAVQVTFDETVLPRDALLDIFYALHDPTTLNRQGADVGPQYRSAMMYADLEQKATFEAALERARRIWTAPIMTEITSLEHFYPAESEHQNYFARNSYNPYCSIVIDPKVTAVRSQFTQYLKTKETT